MKPRRIAQSLLFLAVLLALCISVLGDKDEASSMMIPPPPPEYLAHVFSPDGSLLASVSDVGQRIKLYDITAGKVMRELRGRSPLAFFPDGKTLVSVSRKREPSSATVNLWSVETGQEIHELYVEGERFALSRDGQVLAIGSQTGVRVLDVLTGTERHKVDVEGQGKFSAMALSADGRILCTQREKGRVRLWDLKTVTELPQLEGEVTAVLSALFSPDSQALAIVEEKSITVRLWSVETGKEFRKIEAGGLIAAIAFSPDGASLAASSVDSIDFWEVASGRKIGGVVGITDHQTLVFSPDGRLLAVGRKQPKLIMLWTLNIWANLDRDFQSSDRALRLNPNDETALYQRGLTYLNHGMWVMAIQDFDKVLRLNPNNASAFYARGKAYPYWEKNCAIEDFNEAIRLNPHEDTFFYQRGLVYKNVAYKQAIADFDEALRLNARNGSAYSSRGTILLDLREYDRALQDFDAALQLDPNDTEALKGRRRAIARVLDPLTPEEREAKMRPARGYKAAPGQSLCERIKTKETQ
jgi:WD40 repeat protein